MTQEKIDELNTLSDETLASIVVAYRHLGLLKDKAKLSMQILMTRKKSGQSNFDYEEYINDQIKGAHPIKIDAKQKNILTNIMQTGIKEFKNGK